MDEVLCLCGNCKKWFKYGEAKIYTRYDKVELKTCPHCGSAGFTLKDNIAYFDKHYDELNEGVF